MTSPNIPRPDATDTVPSRRPLRPAERYLNCPFDSESTTTTNTTTMPKLQSLHSQGGAGSGASPFQTRSRRRQPRTADEVIQATDGDAADARISAVRNRYMFDPFASVLAGETDTPATAAAVVNDDPGAGPRTRLARQRQQQQQQQQQRLPITNRGTYVRIKAIDMLVSRFLKAGPKGQSKQVISLGAGSDSRYFRFVADDPCLDVVYHEIDFDANTKKKVDAIRGDVTLKATVERHVRTAGRPRVGPVVDDRSDGGDSTPKAAAAETISQDPHVVFSESEIKSSRYNLHALDLRQLTKHPLPTLANFIPDAPTLVLSECCLCYMTAADGSAIIDAIVNDMLDPSTPAGMILYEAILPFDPFGQQMTANLETRGISFRTLGRYPDLASQRDRLVDAGFGDVHEAADVLFLWDRWIDEEDQDRIKGLEMVDELEEWILLAQHYCVAWGARRGRIDPGLTAGSDDGAVDVFRLAWADLPTQSGDRKGHHSSGIPRNRIG